MLEVYAAGEAPIPGADSRSLSRSIRNLGKVDPIFVANHEQLPEILDQVISRREFNFGAGSGQCEQTFSVN